MLNDVPSNYFSHLDNKGQRRDKDQRPELSRCSVEFVAPSDYMVHTVLLAGAIHTGGVYHQERNGFMVSVCRCVLRSPRCTSSWWM